MTKNPVTENLETLNRFEFEWNMTQMSSLVGEGQSRNEMHWMGAAAHRLPTLVVAAVSDRRPIGKSGIGLWPMI
jgi:hypothetical protein